jgi:hypothetical protein
MLISRIKETTAWAVVDHKGSIVLWAATETERNAKMNFTATNGFDWGEGSKTRLFLH